MPKHGFQRAIKKTAFIQIDILELPSTTCYFAGQSKTELYFRDLKDLTAIFIVDTLLKSIEKQTLKTLESPGSKTDRVNIGLQDTKIYITDNQTGQLTLVDKLNGKTAHFKKPDIRLDNTYLTSDQSLTGRSTLATGGNLSRRLIKLNYLKATVEKSFPLPKQVDGYFCTDGLLKYDARHAHLYYMYLYRGSFLCLDTNLNLLYQSKTIDTVSKSIIELKKTMKNGKLISVTQAKPPQPVNRGMVVYNNHVYMFSALKADNESTRDFKDNQVIDVYGMEKGDYQLSFYLPRHMGIKLRDFSIIDGFLYALYGNYLVKYKLDKAVF